MTPLEQLKKDGVRADDLTNPREHGIVPKASRFLNMQVMCGHCQFKCCNSEFFYVTLSPEESERMQLPQTIPTVNSHCPCLAEDGTGCRYGKDRPVLCKIFPVKTIYSGSLIAFHWCVLHCPTAKNYIFDRMEGDKYVYVPDQKARGKLYNMQSEIRLDKPIEEFPRLIETCKEGMTLLYGEEGYAKVVEELKILNGEDGFQV